MTCPKCQSGSVFDAMGEAPIGVTAWKKCLACGKRWDPTTTAEVKAVVDTVKRAFKEWQPPAETVELGEDERDELEETLVESPAKLAMKDVLVQRTKGDGMGRPGWTPERRARFMATMAAKRGEKPAANGHAPEKKRTARPEKFANAAHKQAVKAAAERATSAPGGGRARATSCRAETCGAGGWRPGHTRCRDRLAS